MSAARRLVRALETSAAAAGCAVRVTAAEERPWSSATFVGARHSVLVQGGPEAADWLARIVGSDAQRTGPCGGGAGDAADEGRGGARCADLGGVTDSLSLRTRAASACASAPASSARRTRAAWRSGRHRSAPGRRGPPPRRPPRPRRHAVSSMPAPRHRLADRAVGAGHRAVEQRRVDEAGDQRADLDAVGMPFAVERLGQRAHARTWSPNRPRAPPSRRSPMPRRC